MKLSGIGVLSALFGIALVGFALIALEGSMIVLLLGAAFFVLGLAAKKTEPSKTCRFCKSEIHAEALVCPKCQREQVAAPAGRRVPVDPRNPPTARDVIPAPRGSR